MSLRTRVFLLLAAPLLLAAGALLWWAETELADRLDTAARRELAREARLAAELVGGRTFSDSLADALGSLTGLRVTFMASDGTVLGDSEVPPSFLPRVENHAGRPEVRAALRGEIGSARRESATVARSLLYVAVPHRGGVVRLSRPTAEVDALRVRTRRFLLAGSLLGLAAAFLIAAAVVGMAARPLRRVREAVSALGRGDLSRRIRPTGEGQAGAVAEAVNEMADSLEGLVEDLRAEKDDLDVLFETLEDGLAVVDPQGLVLEANRAFRRAVGREDVVGRRFTTLVRAPELVEAVERGLEGHSSGCETTLGERTIFASIQPHRGGALVVLRDLTRLRRLEGVRRDFVANVSHELKTPLTGVMGFAEAVAAGDLPAGQAAEFGSRILANARRMRRLVDDLLDLARIEAGRWEPAREEVEVASLARAVWGGLRPASGEPDVDLEIRGAEGELVLAERDALRQIFRNLFDNALRYAPAGSVVRVDLRRRGDVLRIEVADEGPGIPSTHLPRVFERFYRADPARSREEGGTGLGLAIVKHLVTGHGGEVGIDSELGVGTRVWFTLPLADARSGAGASADASSRP